MATVPDGCWQQMTAEQIKQQITLWKDLAETDPHPGIRSLAYRMLVKLRVELWQRELKDLDG